MSVLQCQSLLRPSHVSSLLFETSGNNGTLLSKTGTAPFLVGFAEKCSCSFSSCFFKFRLELGIGDGRHVGRRFQDISCFYHHRRLRRFSTNSGRSFLSQTSSVPFQRGLESLATTSCPWGTRGIEGNNGVQIEGRIQRQKFTAKSFCEPREIQTDWRGLRWEADNHNLQQRNLDDGVEKVASGLITKNCEQSQEENERDCATDDELQREEHHQQQRREEESVPHIKTRQSTARRRNLDRELEMAVRAVQLACSLSQRTQRRVLQKEEMADEKKDRSLVTVADWGVQAVVSWVLAQGLEREEEAIPMVAEEDTTGLRGMEKVDLLQRVVEAVNLCLQEAGIVGIRPPPHPLGAVDVLKAISKGSAEGGKKGRYWVLDPIDGTLGFVRGDQYAIALGLIEDGEVVLAVLGCPNFPLRKEWLRYHHRYYRIAAKLHPPSPGKWHKGLVLTTTKGSGQVLMHPLVVNADGLLQRHLEGPRAVNVSSIDDPAKATFCEPFEKANSSHSFTAGLAQSLGLRNRPLRVYSLAKYAAIARGDAEIFMKFARAGYKEKIWDHAAGVLIVQEAGGVVTDAAGKPLDFSQGRLLKGLDRGIIACSGKALHERLLKAVDASWDSSTL
ncbi:unnamed protein product [Calypogeia fissa]